MTRLRSNRSPPKSQALTREAFRGPLRIAGTLARAQDCLDAKHRQSERRALNSDYPPRCDVDIVIPTQRKLRIHELITDTRQSRDSPDNIIKKGRPFEGFTPSNTDELYYGRVYGTIHPHQVFTWPPMLDHVLNNAFRQKDQWPTGIISGPLPGNYAPAVTLWKSNRHRLQTDGSRFAAPPLLRAASPACSNPHEPA